MSGNAAQINSHILLPKCVLKRFTDENGFLYYYDVRRALHGKQGLVIRSHAKSFNTENGYYSADTEEFLNREIETPIACLLGFIDSCDFNAERFTVPDGFKRVVLDYAYSLLSRSPSMLSAIGKSSTFFDLAATQGIRHAWKISFWNEQELTFYGK